MPDETLPRPRSGYAPGDFQPGEQVVYVPTYGPCECGVVISISKNSDYVFVRYKGYRIDGTATYASDLFKIVEG